MGAQALLGSQNDGNEKLTTGNATVIARGAD